MIDWPERILCDVTDPSRNIPNSDFTEITIKKHNIFYTFMKLVIDKRSHNIKKILWYEKYYEFPKKKADFHGSKYRKNFLWKWSIFQKIIYVFSFLSSFFWIHTWLNNSLFGLSIVAQNLSQYHVTGIFVVSGFRFLCHCYGISRSIRSTKLD